MWLALAVVAGCDDGHERQPATMDLAVADGSTDMVDATVGDATVDGSTMDADDVADLRGDGEFDDPCESHWDCQRGLFCSDQRCYKNSCAFGFRFDDEDWGCVLEGTVAYRTAIECQTDDDCADGLPCRINVCQDLPPCEAAEDCSKGSFCMYFEACLPCHNVDENGEC